MLQSALLAEKQEVLLPPVGSFLKARFVASLIDSAVVGAVCSAMCVVMFKAFPDNTLLSNWNLWLCAAGAFAVGFLDSLISFAPAFGSVFMVAAAILALPTIFDGTMQQELLPLYLWFGSLYLTNWLYHAHFESEFGATPGKRWMKLRIANSAGQKISFIRATIRHALKPLMVTISAIPILHVVLGNRMQLIHDRIARAYVIPASFEAAPPSLVKQINTEVNVPANVEFASLWRRIGGAVLDAVLYYSLAYSLFSTFLIAVYENVAKLGLEQAMMYSIAVIMVVLSYLLAATLVIVLFAAIEGSRLQSTLGKVVFGLRVVNPDGSSINFFNAVQKQVVQSLVYTSLLPVVFLPSLYIAQQFRDSFGLEFFRYAWLIFYFAYGFLLCVTLIKGRQTIVDKLSKRYVILERKRSSVIE
jgi:uncharacterized RDD family membrane protein YckC